MDQNKYLAVSVNQAVWITPTNRTKVWLKCQKIFFGFCPTQLIQFSSSEKYCLSIILGWSLVNPKNPLCLVNWTMMIQWRRFTKKPLHPKKNTLFWNLDCQNCFKLPRKKSCNNLNYLAVVRQIMEGWKDNIRMSHPSHCACADAQTVPTMILLQKRGHHIMEQLLQ